MRKVVGRLLLLVGMFLVVAAGVSAFWAQNSAARLPLNTDSLTHLTGTASGMLTKSDTPVPVKDLTRTQVDPKASDGDVAAIVQTSCVVVDKDNPPDCISDKNDARMINESLSKFAVDRRHDNYAIKDQSKYIKGSTTPYAGIVSKFPFSSEKKTYPYWDGTLQRTIPAVYKGERTINGVKTYEYDTSVPATNAEIAAGTQGTYQTATQIWVEPVTGTPIDQRTRQTLATTDGTKVLDIDVRYTPETVKANADKAASNRRLLILLRTVVPFGGGGLGIVLIVVGAVLLRPRRGAQSVATPKMNKGPAVAV